MQQKRSIITAACQAVTLWLIMVIAVLSAPAHAQGVPPCGPEEPITDACFVDPALIIEGSVMAGDQPLAGVSISTDVHATRSAADGSFLTWAVLPEQPIFLSTDGDSLLRQGFRFDLIVDRPIAPGPVTIRLPEIVEVDVQVETNCGDDVALGECPLSAAIVEVGSLQFYDVDGTGLYRGATTTSVPTLFGTGVLPMFAGTEAIVAFVEEGSLAAVEWDGSETATIRLPCPGNREVPRGCSPDPDFVVDTTIRAGETPLDGAFLDSGVFDGVTDADGVITIGFEHDGNGGPYGVVIESPVSDDRSRPFISIEILSDFEDDEFVVQLPAIVLLEIVVEENCGSSVPLGGCPRSTTQLDAFALGDEIEITNEITARYVNETLPFVGQGSMGILAGSEGQRISVSNAGETESIVAADWDGTNPFIIRLPGQTVRTLAPERPTFVAEPTPDPTATPAPTDEPTATAAVPASTPPSAETSPQELAFTGASTDELATIGALLVVAGASTLLGVRRRVS